MCLIDTVRKAEKRMTDWQSQGMCFRLRGHRPRLFTPKPSYKSLDYENRNGQHAITNSVSRCSLWDHEWRRSAAVCATLAPNTSIATGVCHKMRNLGRISEICCSRMADFTHLHRGVTFHNMRSFCTVHLNDADVVLYLILFSVQTCHYLKRHYDALITLPDNVYVLCNSCNSDKDNLA